MIKKLPFCLLILISSLGSAFAQNTVGLLSYDPMKAYDGYNLIYPHNQSTVYLLDNCGEIAHRWDDEPNFRPGNTAYLLEDGRLVKCKRDAASPANDPIWAGGGGATVEIRDWNNNLEWSYTLNDSLDRLHHDIAPLPNGNILMVVWENKSMAAAIQAGRDTTLITDGELWPDYIIEVDPTTSDIVWEWHAWDHLVQDYDSTKDNFGVVGDHPELIDLNWETNGAIADWMHANAIDYNADLDQILLSVPTFNELWIIDHSTTSAQAAGHTGGTSGKGGDLMYRWGNPATYRAGTADDQTLFYSHDAHWEGKFLDPIDPNRGKIALFNNRVSSEHSTANIFNPGFDMYKNSYPFANGTFGPSGFDWTYTTPEAITMYSNILSSVRLQPNGNTLICVGRWGYAFELTPDEEIVWEYKVPLIAGSAVNQGQVLEINNNFTFRMERYPADYSAFDGVEFTSLGYIEQNPDSLFCQTLSTSDNLSAIYDVNIYPNPAMNQAVLEWDAMQPINVEIYNMMGQAVDTFKAFGGRKFINTTNWESGMYFIQINGIEVQKLVLSK